MVARGGSWRSPTISVMPRPDSSVVERGPEKAGVGGSIPSLATTHNKRLKWHFIKCKRIAREGCPSFAMYALSLFPSPENQTVSVYTRHSWRLFEKGLAAVGLKNLSIRSTRINREPRSNVRLRGRLCVNQGGYEEIKVGWVDVADGDDAEVWCGGGLQGEACAGVR